MAVKGERPQNYKSISQDTQKNLVALTYLHSNPYNFRNAVAINDGNSVFGDKDKLKQNAIDKLNDIIRKSITIEENFYREISNGLATNIAQVQKIINKNDNYFKIFNLLNSKEFVNTFNKGEEERVLFLAQNYLKKDNTEAILDIDKLQKEIEDQMYQEFQKKQTKNNQKKQTIKEIKNYYRKREGELLKEYDFNANQLLYNAMTEFLKSKGFSESENADFYSAFKKAFKIVTTNIDNTEIKLVINNSSNIIGFIGEMGFTLFMNSLYSNMKNTKFGLTYLGELKVGADNKKSPIDFLIGKYGIQSKNSLAQASFNDVELKESSIDTLLSQLFAQDGSIDVKKIRYLLVNISFLQYFGRPNRLKMEDVDEILNYINSVLSGYADFLLARQIELNESKAGIVGKYRNNFYFYKNKYLIPISILLEGVRDTLKNTSNGNDLGDSQIGYINKKLGKTVKMSKISSNINSKQFQEQKRKMLDGLPDDEYTYGNMLGKYGGQFGNRAARDIKIRINYKFINKNLDKINSILRL